ncbi:copper homeostasis protein CutC [Psychroserpens sp. XS_ASV72]|uniref:copper homeostasis protein CutC n=1 Tax=Psychroserpens sp. XS_ASV72 TaxID=3241293 RepID=UPI0035129CE4
MTLEICANSYQSAKNAVKAGAHRIELCSELSVGGITPSYGLIKKVLSEINIETFVLIRPRSGNFCYSEVEFEIMKSDIQICKTFSCHGIVSGVLNKDRTIDIKRTQDLIELSKPLPFTFHRAFDLVPNTLEALETLIKLGANRILTSGQAVKAIDGLENLKVLQKQAKNRINILVGSGVNPENVKAFRDSGFTEIHASASTVILKETSDMFGNVQQTESNYDTIKELLKVISDAD